MLGFNSKKGTFFFWLISCVLSSFILTEFHGFNGDLLTVIVDGLRFREGYDSHVALPSHNGLVLGPLLGLISGFGIGTINCPTCSLYFLCICIICSAKFHARIRT